MLLSAVSQVERLRASLALKPRDGLLPGDLMEGAPDAGKAAAVLVAITDREEPGVILTVRREHLRTHGSRPCKSNLRLHLRISDCRRPERVDRRVYGR